MQDPTPIQVILLLFFAFSVIAIFHLFTKGIDKLADLTEKKEIEIKEKIKKIEIKKNIPKVVNLRNYLIALATLSTIGILVIAIKLL